VRQNTVDWIITQLFLSESGIHEVYVNSKNHKIRCDCDGYNVRGTCKHTKFVQTRMTINGGMYPVEVSNKVSMDIVAAASNDPAAFREIILKYGKIEAI